MTVPIIKNCARVSITVDNLRRHFFKVSVAEALSTEDLGKCQRRPKDTM